MQGIGEGYLKGCNLAFVENIKILGSFRTRLLQDGGRAIHYRWQYG